MSLDDYKGKTLHINYTPKVDLDKEELAERIYHDFRGLSVVHQSHRVAMAKWAIALVEEQMALFLTQIEQGLAEPHSLKPNLTPRQVRRSGGRSSVQISQGGGGLSYRKDRR
jgi:hypothetical protein